jgi:phage terminase large subunit GpA-like protein
MDALSDPKVHTVVFQASSQVGKTEMLLNIVAYFICQDPSPILMVQPTLDMAEAFSKDRLAPMIRDTPALTNRIADPRSRDSGNTLLHKRFPGGHITLAGANSPASLASRPIRIVLLDEVDRYPMSAGSEGDPITLATKRSTTFFNRKIVIVSTPTISGKSRIENHYEKSDQSKFFIACPHCSHRQVLEEEQLKWTEGTPLNGQDGRQIKVADDAWFECVECRERIDDVARQRAVREGVWEPTAPFRGVRGFWLWEGYSPWSSALHVANAWLAAQGKPDQEKAVVNTSFGRSFRETGEAPDWEKLASRADDYDRGNCPEGVLFLTVGVDVQKDYLDAYVWGWAREKERWLIDHQVLIGDTSRVSAPCWSALSDLLNGSYPHASGNQLPISRLAIDSGYNTQAVYHWARKHGAPRVLVMKGRDSGHGLLSAPKTTQQNQQGKKLRRGGIEVLMLNVSQAKTELYGLMRQEKPADGEPFPHGWVHHYREEDEFYRQITAEAFVTRIVKGYQRGEWVKLRPRNEALDCANLARGGHEQFTAGFRESHWRALERHMATEKPKAIPAEKLVAAEMTVPVPAKKKARRGWKLSI